MPIGLLGIKRVISMGRLQRTAGALNCRLVRVSPMHLEMSSRCCKDWQKRYRTAVRRVINEMYCSARHTVAKQPAVLGYDL